jgi:hypothetical protein
MCDGAELGRLVTRVVIFLVGLAAFCDVRTIMAFLLWNSPS